MAISRSMLSSDRGQWTKLRYAASWISVVNGCSNVTDEATDGWERFLLQGTGRIELQEPSNVELENSLGMHAPGMW